MRPILHRPYRHRPYWPHPPHCARQRRGGRIRAVGVRCRRRLPLAERDAGWRAPAPLARVARVLRVPHHARPLLRAPAELDVLTHRIQPAAAEPAPTTRSHQTLQYPRPTCGPRNPEPAPHPRPPSPRITPNPTACAPVASIVLCAPQDRTHPVGSQSCCPWCPLRALRWIVTLRRWVGSPIAGFWAWPPVSGADRRHGAADDCRV